MNRKVNVGNFKISVHGTSSPAILQVRDSTSYTVKVSEKSQFSRERPQMHVYFLFMFSLNYGKR